MNHTDKTTITTEWIDIARRFVHNGMQQRNINYHQLAERLHQQGMTHITPQHLKVRIKRGDFSAAFLIQLFTAMEYDVLDLSFLQTEKKDKHE